MARFIQLISPLLHQPRFGRFHLSHSVSHLLSNILAWVLIVFSLYACLISESTLLIGLATAQIAFCFLILLELFLRKINAGPLKTRRLEMTAYCLGGVILLFLCIYQFSEAFLSLKTPNTYGVREVLLATFSSILGNLILVRLFWKSGLIRRRIRTFCMPLIGILFFNLLSLFITLITLFTPYLPLDALLGMAFSILLFFIAGVIMVDAYWHLADIERKGLKNNESSTR